jgi:hypothetical protein
MSQTTIQTEDGLPLICVRRRFEAPPGCCGVPRPIRP